ncbi:guided entry of tail-anchored proteins factor 1-like [Amphiura filiformis]|uniref:guided entry of tail-anchored proteins factor 1-like n=1 Tax=Amphiura filiformis TaxID=82378 RepID=UPI003B216C23
MGAVTLLIIFLAVFLLGIFQHYISAFVKWLTKQFFKDSSQVTRLKDELKEIIAEQDDTDMKEEFPKYARLGRRKNKIQEHLKSLRQSKTTDTLYFSWGLTLVLNMFHTVCLIFLIWRYRYVELITMNPDWFWPVASLVAFPTGIPGAVGITCWVLICNVILRRLAQVKSTWGSSKSHES